MRGKIFIFFFLTFLSCVNLQKLIVEGEQLPYFQTFDSWDLCYYDGVCYEQRCDNFRGGFYNPVWIDNTDPASGGVERRHWWLSNIQTSSNWNSARQPVACGSVVTGPCFDHTTGNSTGRFMYSEVSACNGVNFEVITPTIRFTNDSKSISFYLYRFGSQFGGGGTVGSFRVDGSANNGTSWTTLLTESNTASNSATWVQKSISLDGTFGAGPAEVVFRFYFIASGGSGGEYSRADLAIDDVLITQNGAPPPSGPWIDPNCTADGTCNPLQTTSTTGQLAITGGDGDGLTDEEIAGIVIGIVGGALCLCCCLCLLLLIALLIISPRKPPDGGDSGM